MTIELLHDRPYLVMQVARTRWEEWGHPPEPVDLGFWEAVTWKESGSTSLPVTWVAAEGETALGAVALGEHEIEERMDRSPWLMGMIVQRSSRGRGIGGSLVAELERWALSWGYRRIWVATGGRAVDFYAKHGWITEERFIRNNGEDCTVLSRELGVSG
jgi:GNAT superfamily N-acetyltransferase